VHAGYRGMPAQDLLDQPGAGATAQAFEDQRGAAVIRQILERRA